MSSDYEDKYTIIESDFTLGHRNPDAGDIIEFVNEEESRLLEAEYVESRGATESERFDYTDLGGKGTSAPERAHAFEVNDPDASVDSVNLVVHEADVHFGGERLAHSIDERYDELI